MDESGGQRTEWSKPHRKTDAKYLTCMWTLKHSASELFSEVTREGLESTDGKMLMGGICWKCLQYSVMTTSTHTHLLPSPTYTPYYVQLINIIFLNLNQKVIYFLNCVMTVRTNFFRFLGQKKMHYPSVASWAGCRGCMPIWYLESICGTVKYTRVRCMFEGVYAPLSLLQGPHPAFGAHFSQARETLNQSREIFDKLAARILLLFPKTWAWKAMAKPGGQVTSTSPPCQVTTASLESDLAIVFLVSRRSIFLSISEVAWNLFGWKTFVSGYCVEG